MLCLLVCEKHKSESVFSHLNCQLPQRSDGKKVKIGMAC